MRIWISATFLLTVFSSSAFAHPEFYNYSKRVSGRFVNCAMCHIHADGPVGVKHGQIGSLNEEELNALGLARQAMKPGTGAKSPILNDFGNLILNELGREKILELKQKPELLPELLSKTGDLDADGVPNAEEFRDGTNPLNSLDGKPWKLFKNNVAKNWFHLFMMILATGFGFWGLHNAILWLSTQVNEDNTRSH